MTPEDPKPQEQSSTRNTQTIAPTRESENSGPNLRPEATSLSGEVLSARVDRLFRDLIHQCVENRTGKSLGFG